MPEEMTNEMSDTTQVNPAELFDAISSVPVSEGVSRDNDADDNEILDRLMGAQEDSEDADNTSVPQDEQAEETQEETSVAQEDSDEDTETRSEPKTEEYEKALAALRRDGVPESAIENMSDDDLLEWGAKRAKVQADVDGYGAKVKELEDRLNSTTETDASDATSEGEGTDQAQSQPDPVTEMNQYSTRISEIFGDEAAEAVMSPIRDLVDQTKAIFQEHREAILSIQTDSTERLVSDTRSRLQERFPRLANDSDFETVIDGMQKLAAIGEYKSLDDLMTDSYRVQFAKLAEQEAKKAEVDRMKDGGQPTTQSQSKTPARSMSGEAREDAALDALLSGHGYDGAVSAYKG
jgi:hypothetical protein